MIINGIKAFSILIIPLILVLITLIGNIIINLKANQTICMLSTLSLVVFGLLFLLACVGQLLIIGEVKNAQVQYFAPNVNIINSRGNMHLFESWIILLTPVFFYSIDGFVGVILTLILMLIVVRIVASQELYVYNIIWILSGYKAYELQIGSLEQYYTVICMGKLSYSDIRERINNRGTYKILSNGTFILNGDEQEL